MAKLQLEVAGNVIEFPKREMRRIAVPGSCFTPQDRMDVTDWRGRARLLGYDRLVIHNCDEWDAVEVGNFLSVYPRGDVWSRWGFARRGSALQAWCCVSGADLGEFDTLGIAFTAVLQGMASLRTARRKSPAITLRGPMAVVTRIDRCGLGSAA